MTTRGDEWILDPDLPRPGSETDVDYGNPIDGPIDEICGEADDGPDIDDVLGFIEREKQAIPPRSEDYEAGLKAVEDFIIWEQK